MKKPINYLENRAESLQAEIEYNEKELIAEEANIEKLRRKIEDKRAKLREYTDAIRLLRVMAGPEDTTDAEKKE